MEKLRIRTMLVVPGDITSDVVAVVQENHLEVKWGISNIFSDATSEGLHPEIMSDKNGDMILVIWNEDWETWEVAYVG